MSDPARLSTRRWRKPPGSLVACQAFWFPRPGCIGDPIPSRRDARISRFLREKEIRPMNRFFVASLAALLCCTGGLGCKMCPHCPDPSFGQRRIEGPFLGGFPQNGTHWGRCFNAHGHCSRCNCPEDAGWGGNGNGNGMPLEPAPGMSAGAVAYPYYTTRGPRDFLSNQPPSIGP